MSNPALPRLAITALLTAALLAGCGDDPGPASAPTAKVVGAADLKAHFERMVEAGKREDRQAAEGLARTLVPSRAELRSVLKPGPETEAFLAAYEGPVLETLPPSDPSASLKASAKHNVIVVHAATTEELAAYVKGTTAYKEFAGGMRRFAQRLAAPGRVWYAVETLEPGKEDGIRYTCLTALADRFVLVVKPWRAMPKEEDAPKEGEPKLGDAGTPK